MVKPGKYDFPCQVLITGLELQELQKQTYDMAESFGLDRRLERYKGNRPLKLYSWDLDCIIDTIDDALSNENEYPDKKSPEYLALTGLRKRLQNIYKKFYK